MERSKSTSRSPFNPLEGCAWPDPDPCRNSTSLMLDDVSQMSEVSCSAIWYPRTEDDVVCIIKKAIDNGVRISLRGTQHSMGGQSLVAHGYVVDTKYLNTISYDECSQLVTCGVGCTWADVIRFLNGYNKSPQVLQSYCSFSVGGTLSVNAHGITSDSVMADSVQAFHLARYDSGSVEVIVCTRPDSSTTTEHTRSEELFGLALGGYGLFGVITQVTLAVADNTNLVLDSLSRLACVTDEAEKETVSEFERIWDCCRCDPKVDIKLARLNIHTLRTASLYVFKRDHQSSAGTSSQLQSQPRQLSSCGRLLYKWALPVMKEYRAYAEETSGRAVDMPAHNYETTRNDVLWESALPLAKLYSPLLIMKDTFILQEFFVPHSRFQEWITEAKAIYQEIDEYQKQGSKGVPPQSLILLNTTIRFVEQDTTTLLSYSTKPEGMYAFVLYFRVKRLPRVEFDLGAFHNRLAELAVRLEGTFYLPYRKCYSMDLLRRAYPRIEEFARKKEKYDPLGVFSNEWFEHYIWILCSDSFRSRWNIGNDSSRALLTLSHGSLRHTVSKEEFIDWLPRRSDPLLDRRFDSYRTLLSDKALRRKFSEEFLVNVFNVAEPMEVMRAMSKAAWDPLHENDLAIFTALREHFHGSPRTPAASLKQGLRSVRQLSRQKKELTHETATVLHRLGFFGRVRTYLSVGDHGKTVRNFKTAGLLNPTCEVFVAHAFQPESDDVSLNAILERGMLEPVANVHIQFDYSRDDAESALRAIPSTTIDLVTINQGLHHFPVGNLYDFLIEVRRVLVEGGLFIFREHDLLLENSELISMTSAPAAMLDLAHSVFNAVTGVSVIDEAEEIRAFRPLFEWRSIMEKLGFVDTMQYGIEQGDPTHDFMLCFSKGDVSLASSRWSPPTQKRAGSDVITSDLSEPPVMATIRTLLAQVPSAVASAVPRIISTLLEKIPAIKTNLSKFVLDLQNEIRREKNELRSKRTTASSGILTSDVIVSILSSLAEVIGEKLEKLTELGTAAQELLRDVNVRETSDIAGLLSTPELWLILPVLKRTTSVRPDALGDFEKTLLNMMETSFPLLLHAEKGPNNQTLEKPTGAQPAIRQGDDVIDAPVGKDEVLDVILTLSENIPGLLDPSIVLADSGLTLSQQSALVGLLAASDLAAFAEKIALFHDQHSWQELRWTLVGDGGSVFESKDLPTAELLFSSTLGHPWHHALKAFFKGPRIQLKQHTLFGMRILKLDELISLYRVAKEEATAERCRFRERKDHWSSLPFEDSRMLRNYTEHFFGACQTRNVKILFNGAPEYDLFDVGEVVSASFGYRSLTSSLTEVTSELRSLHSEAQRQVVGWLPVRENTLVDFRNKGSAAKLGDSMRKMVVSTGTLGLGGVNVLVLTYLPLQSTIDDNAVEQLCDFARKKGLIQADLHLDDGHYTWFKLSEWMQVEIMEIFTKSLDHTPWYHFPFMEFLSIYFRVLFKECRIVANEHGLAKAYGSMAFATDLLPAILMFLVFAQLQLLAYPLKLSLPAYDPEIMSEEVLAIALLPTDETPLSYLRRTIDERVRDAAVLCPPGSSTCGLYRIEIPTFKAMGEILIKIARSIPSARLLRVSNQKFVQTRLAVEFGERTTTEADQKYLNNVISEIESVEGLTVVLQYRFPMEVQSLRDSGELQGRMVHLAVKVFVPSLLTLIRLVSKYDRVSVQQIYDFWSG